MDTINKKIKIITVIMCCLSMLYIVYILFSHNIVKEHLYGLTIILSITHFYLIKVFYNRALFGMLLFYGLLFIMLTPVFSPIDEGAHFDLIRQIIELKKIPTLFDNINSVGLSNISEYAVPGGMQYEAVHPPLYYLLGSLFSVVFINHVLINFFVLRLLGLAMLLTSLYLLFKTKNVLKQHGFLGSSNILTGVIIFVIFINPGVLTRMVTVSNESLVVLLFSLQIYFISKLFFKKEISTKDIIFLSLVSAGLILTKLTVAFIYVIVVLFLLKRKMIKKAVVYTFSVFVVVLPWVVYNLTQYNKLTGTGIHVEYVKGIVNPSKQDYGFFFVLEQLPYLIASFLIPQEYNFPSVPQLLLMSTNILSILLIIVFFIASFKLINYSRNFIAVKANSLNNYIAIISLSLLLGPLLLVYGTISEDVNIMIGRYLYINIIPITILLIIYIRKIIVEKYQMFIILTLVVLSSFILSNTIIISSQFNNNVIAKLNELEFDEIDIKNIEEAMSQKKLEVNDLSNIPIKLGASREVLPLKENYQLNEELLNNIKKNNSNDLMVIGTDSYIVWKINSEIQTREKFLLQVEINNTIEKEKSVYGQLFWAANKSGFTEINSYKFKMNNGKLIIPIGKYSEWQANGGVQFLRFDFDGMSEGDVIKINPSIIKLK